MRVLHVCYSDLKGGAARAAYRLHCAQRRNGLDSQMLVVKKLTDDPNVHTVSELHGFRIALASRFSKWILKLQKSNNNTVHSINLFPSGLLNKINKLAPDIVNLHWLGGETLSLGEISRIQQPIVWTLHDMWAFSGSEHYDDLDNPFRYKQPYNKDNRSLKDGGLDISAWVWRRKQRLWESKKFNIVAPSNWMAKCCKESALFSQQSVIVIPNTLNQNIYKPINSNIARRILNLPKNKFILLFGAMSSTSDPRKGYSLLINALKQLASDGIGEHFHLVVFGASSGNATEDTGIESTYLGYLNDDYSLAILYSAANVFVAPSLQDNLPNTLLESLACNTPCIAFDIGGMEDLIKDKNQGDLCPKVDANLLYKKIKERFETRSQSKRHSIEIQDKDQQSVTLAYKDVYLKTLGNEYGERS